MEPISLGLMILGCVWTGGFGLVHYQVAAKAKAAQSWPVAVGRVLTSEVVVEERDDSMQSGTTWYNPVVTYTYSVTGRELEGRRLRFGNPRMARRKKAEAAVAAYPPGSSTPVRYNPDKPEEAVLETEKPNPVYLALALFGLPFIGIGLAWSQLF